MRTASSDCLPTNIFETKVGIFRGFSAAVIIALVGLVVLFLFVIAGVVRNFVVVIVIMGDRHMRLSPMYLILANLVSTNTAKL